MTDKDAWLLIKEIQDKLSELYVKFDEDNIPYFLKLKITWCNMHLSELEEIYYQRKESSK